MPVTDPETGRPVNTLRKVPRVPYSGINDSGLPDNVKELGTNLRKLWVGAFNGVMDNGGGEGKAMRVANKMVSNAKAKGGAEDHEYTQDEIGTLVADEMQERPTRPYLARFLDMMKKNKGKPVDDNMIQYMMRSSAGWAGQQRKQQMSQKASEITDYRLLYELSEAPASINVLPVPGVYKHPTYGTIRITKERNQHFVDNFNNTIYQDRLPIDAEHESKMSGAFGWMTQLALKEDGSVDAQVEWTDRGSKALADDRFRYFSPEWYDEWVDPTTGDKHKDVLIGGAVTTRPFFKDPALKPLIASELEEMDEEEAELYAETEDLLDLADELIFAEWSTAFINDLPDSSFLYIAPGGSKDDEGKTKPRGLRHFPVRDAQGNANLPHVRNAIARAPQASVPPEVKKNVQEKARAILEKSKEASQPDASEVHVAKMMMPCPECGINHEEGSPHPTEVKQKMANIDVHTFAESPEYKAMKEEERRTWLEKQLGETVTSLATAQGELEAAKKSSDDGSKIATELKTATESLKAAETRIATLEADARRQRFTKLVTSPHRWQFGEPNELVDELESLAEVWGEDSEKFKAYIERRSKEAEQLANSIHFKELGTSEQDKGSSEFQTALKVYREANPTKTEAEAISAVLEGNPQFYSDYRKKMNEAAARGADDYVKA